MIRSGYSAVAGRRFLHTTKVNQDFFSWFAKKKQETKVKAKPVQEVMEAVEQGKVDSLEETTSAKVKLELIPDNFIGITKLELKKQREKELFETIEINKWLSDDKVKSLESLNGIIAEASKNAGIDSAEGAFTDIQSRFAFAKSLQIKTGYIIPDYELTILKSPSDIQRYFIDNIFSGKLARYKSSEPDAIHLTQDTYSAPNVRVVDNSVPVRERKQKLKTLLKTVRDLEEEQTRRVLEEARNS